LSKVIFEAVRRRTATGTRALETTAAIPEKEAMTEIAIMETKVRAKVKIRVPAAAEIPGEATRSSVLVRPQTS
jgi:hypothetical protein